MTPVLMAVCLAAGVLIGLRWKHRRFLVERQKRREAERRNAMFDTQALRTDLDVVGPVQPKPTLHEDGQVTVDPADFYSIRCESSGASPIAMTGERDVDAQDRELTDIYGIDDWRTPVEGAPCGWSDGDTVCGDPAAGTVTWPEGPVDLCATHLAWVRENEDAPVVSD